MILIAGGTGHLGRELSRVLAGRAGGLRVLTREPAKAASAGHGATEFVKGDVRDRSSLGPALVGIDVVISAITGFGPGGQGPRAIDLEGNRNLIGASEAAGVRRFVLLSIHGAGPDHPMELYRAKYRAEELVRGSRLDWAIIRPTVFMELWAGIIGGAARTTGTATIFGRGKNPTNFVSVRDVARFVEVAASDAGLGGAALDVGGPENLTFIEVVDSIRASIGLPVRARHVPLSAMRLGAIVMRRVKPDIARLIQAGIVMDTTDMRFDSTALQRRYPNIRLSRLVDILADARLGTNGGG